MVQKPKEEKMTFIKSITYVFILLLISVLLALEIQAQPQRNRNNTRLVGNMLQRLEQSSSRFRTSLNLALVQKSVDQTQPQNDVSKFQSAFDLAIQQFRNQFTRRLAAASDVESILQRAPSINNFLTHNTFNSRVMNDWATVQRDLTTLASAYGVSWQWNRVTPMKVDSNRSFRLSETELDQLVLQIENGGDKFRVSLTDAFFQRPYDRTRSEGDMNDALRKFKKATDQVRIRFDSKQLVSDDIQRLLDLAQPIDKFVRDQQLSDLARNDWSALRTNLNLVANAYNISPGWINNPSSQTTDNLANRLTGTFRLDVAQSDNARDKTQRATQNLRALERQEVSEEILSRLESPEVLTIERQGITITIASSLAPQSTFEADGREREEQLPDGKSNKVTATLRGEQLVVSSNGYKEDDLNVTFDATQNDNRLRVRRQIFSGRLTQPVVVDSVYNRTAAGITASSSPQR